MKGKTFATLITLAALSSCDQANTNTVGAASNQNVSTASNAAVAAPAPPAAAPTKIRLVNVETAPTGTAFFAYYELPDGRLFACKWDASLNPVGCFPMTAQGLGVTSAHSGG